MTIRFRTKRTKTGGVKLFLFLVMALSLCIYSFATSADTTAPPAPANTGSAGAGQAEGHPAASGPAGIKVTPSSHDFGKVAVGTTQKVILEISNTGGSDLVIKSMDISAKNPSQFRFMNESCPNLNPTIKAGESCTIAVTFGPSSGEAIAASLLIASNASSSPMLAVSLAANSVPQTQKPVASEAKPAAAEVKPAPPVPLPVPAAPKNMPAEAKPAPSAQKPAATEQRPVAETMPPAGPAAAPAQAKPAPSAQKPVAAEQTPSSASSENISVKLSADRTSPGLAATIGGVKFTAAAAGASGNYEYRFWLKGPSTGNEWKVVQDYVPSGTYAWIPAQEGTYWIWAYARNAGGYGPEASAWMRFDVVQQAPATTADVTASVPSPVKMATAGTITFIPHAYGGSGKYEYKFLLKGPSTDNEWKLAQDYGISSTFAWTPTKAGHYLIRVYARNVGSPAESEASAWTSFDVVENTPARFVTLSADKSSPVSLSAGAVLLTARAGGGSGKYEYEFWLEGPSTGNEWKVAREYDASNSFWWAPDQPGTYSVAVYVRNVGSPAGHEAVDGMRFDVTGR